MAAASRGLLITLEGGEGAGKSTQQRLLLAHLRQEGLKSISTREPGATSLGVELRALLMELRREAPCPSAEALLYLADRAQHVQELIAPALEKGLVVVCDRFVDSSEVYQGRARGLGWEAIRQVNRWLCGPIWPALTLLLDLEPEIGFKRVLERQGRLGLMPDRLESEGLAFHQAVRQGFLEQARAEAERIKVVSALSSAEAVAQQVWEHVKYLLEQRGLLAA